MSVKVYQLNCGITGREVTFDVLLYPTVEEMRQGAAGYDPNGDFSGALAICHAEEGKPLVAILRFAVGHLSPEIVSHEAVHAAGVLYAMDILDPDDFDPEAFFDVRHEGFAYLVGALYATLVDCLEAMQA